MEKKSFLKNYGILIAMVVAIILGCIVGAIFPNVKDADGKVTDIAVSYTEGYAEQMFRYSHDYSYLNCFDL